MLTFTVDYINPSQDDDKRSNARKQENVNTVPITSY